MPDEPQTPLRATVLICTFNRCAMLEETLHSLAAMDAIAGGWEVLIVDNNSSDDTARMIQAITPSFPVRLRYLHEARQGKSYALNTGIAAIDSEIVAFTDDDVVVAPRWLTAAVKPMLDDPQLGYTGGPVRAIWGGRPPSWLPKENSNLWGTIAVLDYGSEPFVYEERRRIPIGANMAVRRSVFERAGRFNPGLGRKGRSLLGQEQAEFFYRTRREGIRGLYVPGMELHHHVPGSRLTRRYFRAWWFWKGVSRARLHGIHPETELGIDLRHVTRIGGVPRFALGEIVQHARGMCARAIRGDGPGFAEEEMMLAYSLGYVVESWRAKGNRPGAAPSPSDRDSALAPDARRH